MQNALGVMIHGVNLGVVKDAPTQQETNLIFQVKQEQLQDIQDVKNIKFSNAL